MVVGERINNSINKGGIKMAEVERVGLNCMYHYSSYFFEFSWYPPLLYVWGEDSAVGTAMSTLDVGCFGYGDKCGNGYGFGFYQPSRKIEGRRR